MRVDIGTLGEILKVSPRSIRQNLQADKNFPIAKRGKGGDGHEFETSDVIAWKVARAIEKDRRKRAPAPAENRSALDRVREANAQAAEFELARVRGELIEIDRVMPLIAEQMAALRSALLAVHRQFKDRETARRVDDLIRQALTEFTADHKPVDFD